MVRESNSFCLMFFQIHDCSLAWNLANFWWMSKVPSNYTDSDSSLAQLFDWVPIVGTTLITVELWFVDISQCMHVWEPAKITELASARTFQMIASWAQHSMGASLLPRLEVTSCCWILTATTTRLQNEGQHISMLMLGPTFSQIWMSLTWCQIKISNLCDDVDEAKPSNVLNPWWRRDPEHVC